MINWKKLGNHVTKINNHFHSQKIKLTNQQRLSGMAQEFRKLLEEVGGDDGASDYLRKRKAEDAKLKKIQTKTKKDAAEFLQNKNIIPANSFSAGTNLIGDSDLDFAVLVDKLDEETLVRYSNLFGLNGYRFTEVRQPGNKGVHYVFEKYVDGVEIEMKLREKDYFMKFIYHIHHFNDHVLSKKDKETITWMKYNFKETSKEAYDAFKSLSYEFAAESSGMKELLYPYKN